MKAPVFTSSQFYTHFQGDFKTCNVRKTFLRDRSLFLTEKVAFFEVILSICSDFYQTGTPRFSLKAFAPECIEICNIR